MKHGRYAEGFRSMCRLRAHPIIGARDYYYSYVIYQEEIKEARGAGYFRRMWDCFSIPRIRRANYGASTVMIAQQMCGINSELFRPSCITTVLPSESLTGVQLSPFTAPVSSPMPDTLIRRRCTRLSVTVRSRSWLPSRPCS